MSKKIEMNIKTKIISLSFIAFMFFNAPIFAQDNNYALITKELTNEQKALLKKEREVMIANRKAFKETLTKEQLTILKDKTLSKGEMRNRLTASFTRKQKDLVKNQQVRLRQTRETFRKTLTKEQRKILKQRIDKIRNTKDRGELREGSRQNNPLDGKKRRIKN